MDIKIVDGSRLTLAGFSFYGDPFETNNVWTSENQIGLLWDRFTTFMEGRGSGFPGMIHPAVGYEVHIHGPSTAETGQFEVFVGVEVDVVDSIPLALLVKVLPKSTYAVFTIRGPQIVSDWNLAIDQWLSENHYIAAHPFNFQYYDERFLGMDKIDDSEIDIFVPIQKH